MTHESMTPADEIREALAKMTPGDWVAAKSRSSVVGIPIVSNHEGQCIANCSGYHPDDPASYISECLANAAGIVTLRNLTPALLADRDRWKERAEKAEAEVARLREALAKYQPRTFTAPVGAFITPDGTVYSYNNAALEASHD